MTDDPNVFKFLDGTHIESLLRGRLKFGRALYYALLETVFGDSKIGDRHEALAETVTSFTRDRIEEGDALIERLRESGAVNFAAGVTNVSVQDLQIIQSVDCYILSLSIGELSQLVPEMCSSIGGRPGYDSCVQIHNVDRLAEVVWSTGLFRDQPLSETFEMMHSGRVRYDRQVRDLDNGPVSHGDPFVKDGRYKRQNECRLVLFPKAPLGLDHVFVEAPAAAALLSRVVVNSDPLGLSAPGEFDPLSAEQLRAFIRETIVGWHRLEQSVPRLEHARFPRNGDQAAIDAWQAQREANHRSHTAAVERAEVQFSDQTDRLKKAYFELRRKTGATFERPDTEIAYANPSVRDLCHVLERALFPGEFLRHERMLHEREIGGEAGEH